MKSEPRNQILFESSVGVVRRMSRLFMLEPSPGSLVRPDTLLPLPLSTEVRRQIVNERLEFRVAQGTRMTPCGLEDTLTREDAHSKGVKGFCQDSRQPVSPEVG